MRFGLLLTVLWLFAGCTALPVEKKSIQQNNAEDSGALKQGAMIVEAIVKGDYRSFVKNSGENAAVKDNKEFDSSRKQMEKSMGKFKSWRLLGTLQTPLLINQIYAIKFAKKSSYGKDVEHEHLFQLLFGMQDDHYKLIGMRFI